MSSLVVPAAVAAVVLAVLLTAWHASRVVRDLQLEQASHAATAGLRTLSPDVRELVEAGDRTALGDVLAHSGRRLGLRLWLELPSGLVVGDPGPASRSTAVPGVVHASAPGSPSELQVALVIPLAGDRSATLRGARPLDDLESAIARLWLGSALVALCLGAAAGLLAHVASVRAVRNLQSLGDWALEEQGDAPAPDLGLPAELQRHADDVSRALQERTDQVDSLAREHDQLAGVIASMHEAVLVVDATGRVELLNAAAELLFGTRLEEVHLRPFPELFRSAELEGLVARTLAGEEPVEGELVLQTEEAQQRYLQAWCTRLRPRSSPEAPAGAVIVFGDVTRIRKLENLRREFVANVSHELRTPITTIQGFVETLLDGALADRDEAEHFLRIISRHAERLNAIVEDLLTLARLEQEDESALLRLEPVPLLPVVRSGVENCRPGADRHGVDLSLECDSAPVMRLDAPLLERAVTNLVDNAIKYSDTGTQVRVRIEAGDEVVITVSDEGQGIEAQHLPRLFERFYRVDHARSRKLGGTGLGLAIVKHVAQTHGGRVSVESRPGVGSVFRIHLPSASADAARTA